MSTINDDTHHSSIVAQQNFSLPIKSSAFDRNNLSFVECITIYLTFIVSVAGLIGNACTILVLNRKSMRKWRSSMLLTALAIVDFLYLSIIFFSLIDELTPGTIGLNRSLILCQTTVYITHVCSFLSASFTLSFTFQRFIAVHFPLQSHRFISTRPSTINIVVLLIIGCSFYSFSFFLTNISHGQCREDEEYPLLFPLLIVDICITCVFPFIIIVVFNVSIVYKLQTRNKFGTVKNKVSSRSINDFLFRFSRTGSEFESEITLGTSTSASST